MTRLRFVRREAGLRRAPAAACGCRLLAVACRRGAPGAARRSGCTELATRNGSMPMFISRLIVLGASLVCSVESTRWPVSAALTAISAVSKSRISPTRMMFGSWRRNERSAAAKFRPMFSRTCTWLMPTRLNSTGSSAVMMLVSGVLILRDRRVERVGLAAAGRAGDEHHAPRLARSRPRTWPATPARSRASSCRASACPCRADA